MSGPLIPLGTVPDTLTVLRKMIDDCVEEMRQITGIDAVMDNLVQQSLHGTCAVRMTLNDGKMNAAGPFPVD